MRLFKRKNAIVQRVQRQIRTAIPDLAALLSSEITYLEELDKDGRASDDGVYPTSRLVKVLKAAAFAHLRLKLDKPNNGQLALLKYLNPSDTSQQGFTASCLRAAQNMKDGLQELHLVELKGIYVFLLSRLD